MKPKTNSAARALVVALASACANGATVAQSPEAERTEADRTKTELPRRFQYESSTLAEISGLALSQRNPSWLWAHEDSGNSAQLIAIAPNGNSAFRYRLSGARNFDWEDICVARRKDGTSFLVIADVGRNLAKAGQAMPRLWITPEPRIADFSTKKRAAIEGMRNLRDVSKKRRLPKLRTSNTAQWLLRYKGIDESKYPDVEAAYFDPRSQDFVLVTKTSKGPAELWRVTPPRGDWMREASLEATLVARIQAPGKRRDRLITAACFDRARGRLMLTTYERLLVLEAPRLRTKDKPANEGDRETQSPPPTLELLENRKLPNLDQIEALALLPNGSALIASEGKRARFALIPLPTK